MTIARAYAGVGLSRAAWYRPRIAFVERFNRTYRHEVLDAYVFDSLEPVRLISEGWLQLYNEERPHRALGRLPPARFAERRQTPENSSYPAST